mgnify:CR=1 FL=1
MQGRDASADDTEAGRGTDGNTQTSCRWAERALTLPHRAAPAQAQVATPRPSPSYSRRLEPDRARVKPIAARLPR